MKKCHSHIDVECMPLCPGRLADTPFVARAAPSSFAMTRATRVDGKLCGICKAQREKRTGPIEVDLAANVRDCDVCGAAIRNMKERGDRARADVAEAKAKAKGARHE